MLIDYQELATDLDRADSAARDAEAAGYDGFWTAETKHNPFLPLVLAAEHTEHVYLGTGIAVAFARNPMTVAHVAWDLQAYSEGRFILGLGSQVKPHIRLRFSMEWSHPAARMRDFISALHAIWDAWEEGTPLRYRGEFYTHALMTPFFDPGPNPHGRAKVFVAAVGTKMIEVAGAVGDGLLGHPLTTEAYVREVVVPTFSRALDTAQRPRSDFQLSQPVFVVTGSDDRELAAAAAEVRQQIAFYASTPSYRGVLEHHGWGEIQPQLNDLARSGEWAAMGDLIDDEKLETFAVVGPPEAIGPAIRRRFDGVADRISFYPPEGGYDPETMGAIIEGTRGQASSQP